MSDDRARFLLAGGDRLRIAGVADGAYLRRRGEEIVGDTPEAGQQQAGEAFPVGSVFIAVVNTNPSQLLGYGTWAAFGAGRVMIGFDEADADFDAAEKVGGSKTATPAGSVSQPTFSGTQANLAHSGSAVADHALNLAHSGAAVSAHSGAAVADHASHTHTYTQVPNHVHVQRLQGGTTGATTGTHLMGSTATGGNLRSSAQSTLDPTGGVASATTAGPNAALTHSVTQPANHTVTQPNAHSDTLAHSVTQPSAHTYTPDGTVSQPTFAGEAQSIVQSYITCHFWKRTA